MPSRVSRSANLQGEMLPGSSRPPLPPFRGHGQEPQAEYLNHPWVSSPLGAKPQITVS